MLEKNSRNAYWNACGKCCIIAAESEVEQDVRLFPRKLQAAAKKADLTQEQAAEIFQVSPQSVSRWETGANYPDVELLPHIAGFFNVTVDGLLGTDEIRNEEKTAAYTKDIRNLLNSGRPEDAIALARKAAKEYPLHTGLHYLLVQAMSAACDEAHKDEIIATNLRIIHLSDYKSSLSHRVQLIRQYGTVTKLIGQIRRKRSNFVIPFTMERSGQDVNTVVISIGNFAAFFIPMCIKDAGNGKPLRGTGRANEF